MAFLRPFFIFLRLCPAWVAGALLLSGCDQGPSTRVIDVRMRELEDKIKLLEKRTDSAMLAAETGSGPTAPPRPTWITLRGLSNSFMWGELLMRRP